MGQQARKEQQKVRHGRIGALLVAYVIVVDFECQFPLVFWVNILIILCRLHYHWEVISDSNIFIQHSDLDGS